MITLVKKGKNELVRSNYRPNSPRRKFFISTPIIVSTDPIGY